MNAPLSSFLRLVEQTRQAADKSPELKDTLGSIQIEPYGSGIAIKRRCGTRFADLLVSPISAGSYRLTLSAHNLDADSSIAPTIHLKGIREETVLETTRKVLAADLGTLDIEALRAAMVLFDNAAAAQKIPTVTPISPAQAVH